ncbi:alpha-galactosidase [Duganella sp. BJB488]|uniref:NPCBM/NEW2 domain-containing protein n=1 Tax=unclassified Duganella TaxID=2636909 RepID=UPI000E34E27B|nr:MULTISPECIES: NPCBM/NEW2 domain-containing protein [unclassified Duganella]RFP24634.1 alpha-galactosidase [Duganella sp. BJB489]RFP26992.1 alpha-galactosidase [Duganella sp. BJB488]RFP34273.1 alpha-galactosidase [Duganella sp. BJB480]
MQTTFRRPPRLALITLWLAAASLHAAADPLAPTARWSAYTAGRAATPPMGWSSWNAFGTDIDEAKILGSAQRIADSGLAARGYRYINIDDGWAARRQMPDGRLVIRAERFPSSVQGGGTSFRPLTDKLHAMGLKAGIYSDLGRNTCSQAYSGVDTDLPKGSVLEREIGLYGHIDQDINLFFGDWGFDFIKVDGCGLRAYGANSAKVRSGQYRALTPVLDLESVSHSDIPAVQAEFTQINAALKRNKPDGDFLLSLCIWGAADVRAWGKNYGNLSRTSDDITPSWSRLLSNFDSAARRELYGHPGGWNDPDMLYIGKGDFDADHLVEAKSHFALWAMLNAPLMLGADLRTMPQPLMDIVGNADIIAVNQDPAGNQAVLAYDADDLEILVKPLASGQKAVAIFNRGLAPIDVDLTAEQLKFRNDAPVKLTDLWTKADSTFTKETKLRVAPRETRIFRVSGERALAQGVYLSEQPGSVNPAVDGVVRPQADPTIFRSSAGWTGTKGPGERPMYAGWGGARADSTPYGQVMQIAGTPYAAGIGILVNSRLEVRNQGYRRLSAQVGVDDSAQDRKHDVTFMIYGDGKLLAKSKPLRWGQPAQALSADVAGVRMVELVARSAAGTNEHLPVSWGNAALFSSER